MEVRHICWKWSSERVKKMQREYQVNREVKEKKRGIREIEEKCSALSETENYCNEIRKCKKKVGKLWESLQDEKCGKLCMSCICNQKSQN